MLDASSRFTRGLLRASLLCSLALGVGCGDDTEPHAHDGDHPHPDGGHEDGHPDGHVEEDDYTGKPIACTADFPPFGAGAITAMAGELKVELASVTPAQPRQKLANDWIIKVTDAAGAPAAALAFEAVVPFMRVHGHPSPKSAKVMPQSEPGSYLLDNVYFHMTGPWEVSVIIKDRGTATLKICVE